MRLIYLLASSLQMIKLRHREVNQLTQSDTTRSGKAWAGNRPCKLNAGPVPEYHLTPLPSCVSNKGCDPHPRANSERQPYPVEGIKIQSSENEKSRREERRKEETVQEVMKKSITEQWKESSIQEITKQIYRKDLLHNPIRLRQEMIQHPTEAEYYRAHTLFKKTVSFSILSFRSCAFYLFPEYGALAVAFQSIFLNTDKIEKVY